MKALMGICKEEFCGFKKKKNNSNCFNLVCFKSPYSNESDSFLAFFILCFLRPSTFHNFPSFEHFLSFLLFGEYLRKNCYELTISRPLSQVPSIGQHSKDVWSGVSFLLSFYVVFAAIILHSHANAFYGS